MPDRSIRAWRTSDLVRPVAFLTGCARLFVGAALLGAAGACSEPVPTATRETRTAARVAPAGPDCGAAGNAEFADLWVGTMGAIAVGPGGVAVHLRNGALCNVATGTTRDLHAVWARGLDDAWAVGDSGTVLRFDGEAWIDVPFHPSIDLLAVWGDPEGRVYAVGESQFVHVWDDSSWTSAALDNTGAWQYRGIWGSSASDIWVVGGTAPGIDPRRSRSVRYDGSAWTPHPVPLDGYLDDVSGLYATRVYAAGLVGVVRFTGSVWQSLTGPHWARAVAVTDDGTLFVAQGVGDQGGILRYDGDAWQNLSLPVGSTPIASVRAHRSRVYAATADGTLLRLEADTFVVVR